MSSEGRFGEWRAFRKCPQNGVIVGFQLRSMSKQGSADDTSATDINFFCDSDVGLVELPGDGVAIGVWTAEQMCPVGYGVCGIRTQVEGWQGTGKFCNAVKILEKECMGI